MKRRSGGSSASSRSISCSSRATSASPSAAFVDARGDLVARDRPAARRARTGRAGCWTSIGVELRVERRRRAPGRARRSARRLRRTRRRARRPCGPACRRTATSRRCRRCACRFSRARIIRDARKTTYEARRKPRAARRRRRSPAVPPAAADLVSAATAAICRGARPTTRTTSSCPKSCCSRRRSIACCRSTRSGSTSIRRSKRSPPRPKQDVDRDVVSARLQHPAARLQTIAREAVASYGGAAAGRRGDAAVVQGHRRVHRRRDPQLRVPPARGDSRHQRRARAVSRVRRQGRSEEPRDEAASVDACRQRSCRVAHVFDFNQALMDFGAMVCVGAQPEVPRLPDGEELPLVSRSRRTPTMT